MLAERGINVTISYMDIRSMGEYETYYNKALKLGVKFIRGRVSLIEKDTSSDKLILFLEDTEKSKVIELKTDLVILTPRLKASEGTLKIDSIIKLGLDVGGFLSTQDFNNVSTKIPGIFVCGASQSPRDIPETVITSYAAVMQVIHYLRNTSGGQ